MTSAGPFGIHGGQIPAKRDNRQRSTSNYLNVGRWTLKVMNCGFINLTLAAHD